MVKRKVTKVIDHTPPDNDDDDDDDDEGVDVLHATPEQLIAINLDDHLPNLKKHTIPQLRAWYTDHASDGASPPPTKKAPLVKVVMSLLFKIQQEAAIELLEKKPVKKKKVKVVKRKLTEKFGDEMTEKVKRQRKKIKIPSPTTTTTSSQDFVGNALMSSLGIPPATSSAPSSPPKTSLSVLSKSHTSSTKQKSPPGHSAPSPSPKSPRPINPSSPSSSRKVKSSSRSSRKLSPSKSREEFQRVVSSDQNNHSLRSPIINNIFQSSPSSITQRRKSTSVVANQSALNTLKPLSNSIQSSIHRSHSVLQDRHLPGKTLPSRARKVAAQPTSVFVQPASHVIRPKKLFSPSIAESSAAPRKPRVVTVVVPPSAAKSSRYRSVFNVILALIVALLAYYIASRSLTQPFCDTHYTSESSECVPCPKRANCNDGIAKCAHGLVLQGVDCVDNPEVLLLADDLYLSVAELAARRAGEVECGMRESTDANISMTELERQMRGVYAADVLFDEAWPKARFRIMIGENTSNSLRHSAQRGVWSTVASKPLSCLLMHWCNRNKLMICIFILTISCALRLHYRRRLTKRRHEQASIVFKKALLLLKDSSGAFALDHLNEHAFELSGIEKDPVVWAMAIDQLVRDARINNAVTSVNGRQCKGLLFTHTPMKSLRGKTVHVYPSVQ